MRVATDSDNHSLIFFGPSSRRSLNSFTEVRFLVNRSSLDSDSDAAMPTVCAGAKFSPLAARGGGDINSAPGSANGTTEPTADASAFAEAFDVRGTPRPRPGSTMAD